jgi:iron complex outermembrane receptor protein
MKITLSAAGLLAALLQPISFVQAAVLEEIIVTSERREENLQEVPIAVTALNMDQLGSLQVNEARDLQRYTPSLNMFNNITHPSNLSLSLRGGLQQDASLVTAESPVGIYLDDIYVARLNGNNVTLSDIERVEVLRGPQGTLYGRNTGYGAVRFISRTPGEDMWADATAGLGNDEQILVRGSAGGPISDSWAASVAGQFREKDEQFFNFHPTANTDTGHEKNTAFRGKLRYMGSDTFDAIFSLAFSQSRNDSNQMPNGTTPLVPDDCQDPEVMDPDTGTCPAGVTTQFTTEDLVFTNGIRGTNTAWMDREPKPLVARPAADTQQTIMGLTLTWDINDNLTFKSITGIVGLDSNFMTDFNGNTGLTFDDMGNITSGGLGFVGGSETKSDSVSQEFQLLGSAMDDRLNYVAGLYWFKEDSTQFWGWNFAGPLSQSTINTETDSIAVFGEASFNITDNLKVTAGARWTEDDKFYKFDYERFDGNFFSFIPGFGATTDTIILEQEPSDVLPRFVIDYQLNNMMFYGSVAKGFKGAGFSSIAILSTEIVGVYDDETNWTYEAGMKADWFNSSLRTNLAYFFSDIEDIQQNSTNAEGPGLEFPVKNSGDAEIQGLEFEISWLPLDGLNLFASGSLMDGEYTRLNEDSDAFKSTFNFGVQPETPQTPDYAINLGFAYTYDFNQQWLSELSFGLDYYEIDEYITSASNEFRNSGWDQLNGFISLGLGDNWSLKLTGKNLTDEDNITSGSRGLGGFIVMAPVEYLFTVTYEM